jgi:biotin operon repressor
MRTNVRNSEPTLRGEIEYLLQNRAPDFERDCALVGTAWTAEAIAEELSASTKAVQRELQILQREGRVTTRRPRSGHTLWKLTDDLHEAWQAFAGHSLRRLSYS